MRVSLPTHTYNSPQWMSFANRISLLPFKRHSCIGERGVACSCGACRQYRYPDSFPPATGGCDEFGSLKSVETPCQCHPSNLQSVPCNLAGYSQVFRGFLQSLQVPEKETYLIRRTSRLICCYQPKKRDSPAQVILPVKFFVRIPSWVGAG